MYQDINQIPEIVNDKQNHFQAVARRQRLAQEFRSTSEMPEKAGYWGRLKKKLGVLAWVVRISKIIGTNQGL